MSDTVVSTPNGKVKGEVFDLKRKDAKLVYKYRNIPYGKPPVGSLRFMPPQPAEPWNGIKDGTVPGNKPMYDPQFEDMLTGYFPFSAQGEKKHDEDCLHVSVYTPSIEKGKNLPVMVWIYGGGFSMGSERDYDGSVIAGMNDVVLVVPNYRVGIFGFLTFGSSSTVSGNQGIMDQQLALKWVQNNIDVFGGDKNNVTIFGESAGASSVSMHMMSPFSRGLFHKGISHSGTATIPSAIFDDKSNAGKLKKFFKHIKMEDKDHTEILEKLQKMPAAELVAISGSMELMMEKVTFQPFLDGKILPKSGEESIKSKDFAKVPYIIGCNSTEGQGIMALATGPAFEKGLTEDVVKKTIYFPITDEGFEKCKNFYIKPGDEDEARFSKLLGNILGDAVFVAPSIQIANAYSDAGSNIYVYYGDFKLKMFHEKEYMGDLKSKVDWCVCDHGDDVHMTFGIPLAENILQGGAKYSEDEKKLSQKFMTYLTNFAHTGDPNKGKKVEVTWPKYQTKDKGYLVVGTPISTGKNLSPKAVDFWLKEMKQYIKEE